MQRLGKVVYNNRLPSSGTVPNPDLLLLDPVGDAEISDANVFGTFSAGKPAVVLEKNGALIVLVKNTDPRWVSCLFCRKVSKPRVLQ